MKLLLLLGLISVIRGKKRPKNLKTGTNANNNNDDVDHDDDDDINSNNNSNNNNNNNHNHNHKQGSSQFCCCSTFFVSGQNPCAALTCTLSALRC